MAASSRIFSSRSLTFSSTGLPSSPVWLAVVELRLGEEELELRLGEEELKVWLGEEEWGVRLDAKEVETRLVVDVEAGEVWLEGLESETVSEVLLVMDLNGE